MTSIKNDVLGCLWKTARYQGLTPGAIADELGLMTAQVSRVLRSELGANLTREKSGRTFLYRFERKAVKAAKKPSKKTRKPSKRKVARRAPVGFDVEPGWLVWGCA